MIELIKLMKFTLSMEHELMNKTFKFHEQSSMFTKTVDQRNLIVSMH